MAGEARLVPRDGADVAEAIAQAHAARRAIEIVGGGSKRRLGAPVAAELTLDLSGLSGITLYEPSELVLTARAGTKLSTIEATLHQHGQMLAFEPADWGPVYERPAGEATIGGILSVNQSGPRRIKAGAARDHFLGFSAVNGRGETFKSGGRVVKNVTGYDVSKLMAGSFGTLAALTEVTLKVLPRAESEATLACLGLDARAGQALMRAGLAGSADLSAAAYLPAGLARTLAPFGLEGARGGVALLRLEGPEASLAARLNGLRDGSIGIGPESARVDGERSRDLWRFLGRIGPLVTPAARALWRLSVPPAAGAEALEAVGGEAYLDWGGGLVWLSRPLAGDAGAARLRELARTLGGHASLIRASDAIRRAVPMRQPEPEALAALSRRIKAGFDPLGLLNPGRLG